MLWGLYYAVLLILEKLFLLRWLDKAPKWVGHVYTIFAFIMGWVLFAITDFGQLGQYVSAMFTATFVDGTALYLLRSNVVLLIAATIGCTTGCGTGWRTSCPTPPPSRCAPWAWCCCCCCPSRFWWVTAITRFCISASDDRMRKEVIFP